MKKQSLPTLEESFTGTLYGNTTNGDKIIELDPAELQEINDQPFQAYTSEQLQQLADSIRENGQQQPCIVRKKNNKYIILAGRNRKRACKLAGCKVKCIIRECTDAEADLILTDTNLYQRHELLPSELARAYKMQKAAYEVQGEKKSTAAIANTYGETTKTIQRYIKLADLNENLLAFVDSGRIPVMVGVMLTNTTYPNNQERLADYLKSNPSQKVSLKQAEGLIKLESLHDWYNDILNDFFAGRINLSEPDRPKTSNSRIQPCTENTTTDELSVAEPQPPVHECKPVEKYVRDSSGSLPLPNQETVFTADDISEKVATTSVSYQRLTHERCNGIKSGYWSDASKEQLVQQLAEFENAYPDGPKGV